MAGYNNPILGAVLGRQQAELQNKQFEANLALQLGQFAEQKRQFGVDHEQRRNEHATNLAYNYANLGESKRQAKVTSDHTAKVYKEAQPQRAATLAGTEADTNFTKTQTEFASAQTAGQKIENDTNALALQASRIENSAPSYFENFVVGNEPISAEQIFSTPELTARYVDQLNQDGIRQSLFSGSEGEDYFVKSIVPLEDGRHVIQLYDPKNPEKEVYLSKYRTAQQGDPISAGNLQSFGIIKSQIDAAYFNAKGLPMPAAAQSMADTISQITGQPPGLLNNQTVSTAIELGGELEQSGTTQAPTNQSTVQVTPAPLGTVDGAAPDLQPVKGRSPGRSNTVINTALASINTIEDVDAYDPEFLGQISDTQIDRAINEHKADMKKIRPPTVRRGGKRNTVLTDEQKVEQARHKTAIDALTQLKNGERRVATDLTEGQQKAANNATANEMMPMSFVGTPKEAAVEAQIKAAMPKTAGEKVEQAQQIADNLRPSQKGIDAKTLFNLKRLEAFGFIDRESIQRVLDLGVFSSDSVGLMKQQIIEQGDLAVQELKNQAAADKPTIKTLADGSVVSLDINGKQQWRFNDPTDGRPQDVQSALVAMHNNEGEDGLDLEDSITSLTQQLSVATEDNPLPQLEQNLLSQNLNQYLLNELSIYGLFQPYDWAKGSDEDDVHNPLDRVTKSFSLDPNTGNIQLWDDMGEQHADRDFNISEISSVAVREVLEDLLKTPSEVSSGIVTSKLENQKKRFASVDAMIKGIESGNQ